MNISGQIFLIALGLQDAVAAVIGNSIGENNEALARRYYKITSAVAVCVFLAVAICTLGAQNPLI